MMRVTVSEWDKNTERAWRELERGDIVDYPLNWPSRERLSVILRKYRSVLNTPVFRVKYLFEPAYDNIRFGYDWCKLGHIDEIPPDWEK